MGYLLAFAASYSAIGFALMYLGVRSAPLVDENYKIISNPTHGV